jgi:hypothetical protein
MMYYKYYFISRSLGLILLRTYLTRHFNHINQKGGAEDIMWSKASS